jgi:hypothetical protein
MVLSKRGVFFTLGAILLVSVLILLFTGTQRARQVEISVVADTLNNFRIRFEETYVPLISRQYSYQTLYALE